MVRGLYPTSRRHVFQNVKKKCIFQSVWKVSVLECALFRPVCVLCRSWLLGWWSRLSCLVVADKRRLFLQTKTFITNRQKTRVFSNEIKVEGQLRVISRRNKHKTVSCQQPLRNLPRRRQKISNTMSTFFLLLSTPLLLLLNVEVPPFLVSCAIAFSYMYFCIWKVPGSLRNPTPMVSHALKIGVPARTSGEVNQTLLYKRIQMRVIEAVSSQPWVLNGPALRTQEGKVCSAGNEWKARSLLSQLVQTLEAWEICCAHPPPRLLYQSFFSSPLFSPGPPLQLSPLLSTGGG